MAPLKDLCPMLIIYFEPQVKGFPKRIPSYIMDAWYDRNQWPKMVILVKIVKIGQLQMPVESREPINDSGFFRLKHRCIIGEQIKLHMEGFCRGPSPQKIPKWPWRNGHKICWCRKDPNNKKYFFSKSYRVFSSHHFGPFPD